VIGNYIWNSTNAKTLITFTQHLTRNKTAAIMDFLSWYASDVNDICKNFQENNDANIRSIQYSKWEKCVL